MPLLEIHEAAFVRGGAILLADVSLCLDAGAELAYACTDARSASILAMIAAGLLRHSSGRVFVGSFDPRIQPVHVKRIAGYVQHDALPHEFPSFSRYVEYRAALWGLPRDRSLARARALLAQLDGIHEAFAYPLVGALLAAPALLVLDRPQAVYAQQIRRAAEGCAILSTHACARDAERFAPGAPVPA